MLLSIALFVAALGLVASGIAYGYRVALQNALETNKHLRAQVQYMSGVPDVQVPARLASGQR